MSDVVTTGFARGVSFTGGIALVISIAAFVASALTVGSANGLSDTFATSALLLFGLAVVLLVIGLVAWLRARPRNARGGTPPAG